MNFQRVWNKKYNLGFSYFGRTFSFTFGDPESRVNTQQYGRLRASGLVTQFSTAPRIFGKLWRICSTSVTVFGVNDGPPSRWIKQWWFGRWKTVFSKWIRWFWRDDGDTIWRWADETPINSMFCYESSVR